MKFAIVGTGMIAGFHAQAIKAMKNGTLGGIADQTAERATAFASKHDTIGYPSLDHLLSDPSIDIVTIATPSGAHFLPAMAAINAGKHVIVEKPLEVTTERVDALIKAAEQNGVTLAAILNRRFHPAMDVFKQAVDEDRFGQLTSASVYVKWYRDQAYYDSAPWRGTWALDGGGSLMNQSIHAIDTLLHLAGPVKSVQANIACLAHHNIEVEDSAVAILEFTNGARGVIEGSTCAWSKVGHPARVQLAGTHGSAFLADESFEIWDFMNERPEDDFIRNNFMQNAAKGLGANDPSAIKFHQHQRNFEEIVDAINENRVPTTSAHEARKSIDLIRAIYHSAQNDGQKITLA